MLAGCPFQLRVHRPDLFDDRRGRNGPFLPELVRRTQTVCSSVFAQRIPTGRDGAGYPSRLRSAGIAACLLNSLLPASHLARIMNIGGFRDRLRGWSARGDSADPRVADFADRLFAGGGSTIVDGCAIDCARYM
jgi:hypothetical protein